MPDLITLAFVVLAFAANIYVLGKHLLWRYRNRLDA